MASMASMATCSSVIGLFIVVVVVLSVMVTPSVRAAEEGVRKTQVALHTVSVENEADSLELSVTYNAQFMVNASWSVPQFINRQGTVNMDFDQTDSFDPSKGLGRTTMRIRRELALAQNHKVYTRRLRLRTADLKMDISFPPFHDLINTSFTTQDFGGLVFQLRARGRRLVPGDDVLMRRRGGFTLEASLQSPELHKFDTDRTPWVRLSKFAYHGPGDFMTRDSDWGHDSDSAIRDKDEGWRGDGDSRWFHVQIRNRRRVTGILELMFVTMAKRSGVQSLVHNIDFRQNVYIVQRAGDVVVKENSVYFKADYSHLLTEFDKPVFLQVPSFTVNVVGNPLPEVALYRGCRRLSEDEVSVVETRIDSRYELTHTFQFHNATEELDGSYTVVARSGLMEAREMMSIGVVS